VSKVKVSRPQQGAGVTDVKRFTKNHCQNTCIRGCLLWYPHTNVRASFALRSAHLSSRGRLDAWSGKALDFKRGNRARFQESFRSGESLRSACM